MPSISLTGRDTIKLNGRILNDFADADTAVLTFPNDITEIKTGKNGNSIYAFKYSGRQCELVLRILRGGSDDKFIQGLFANLLNAPELFSLIQGEFTKVIGDGLGNITNDVYSLSGGTFKSEPEVKENADGDTNQAITEWKLKFSNAPRSIT